MHVCEYQEVNDMYVRPHRREAPVCHRVVDLFN